MPDTRKKLIELLKSNPVVLDTAGKSATSLLRLADHLISNGVTVLPESGDDCPGVESWEEWIKKPPRGNDP